LPLMYRKARRHIAHACTGCWLLKAVLRFDHASATFLAARWFGRNMAKVIICAEAVTVAKVILDILVDHEDANYKDVLDG